MEERKTRHVGARALQALMVAFGVFATVCGIPVPVILLVAIPYDVLAVWCIRRMNRNIREGRGAFTPDRQAKALAQAERGERRQALMEERFFGLKPAAVLHVSGLPLAQGAPCSLHSEAGLYRIESGGAQFTLDKSKVVDVSAKTDEEVQKQYVSSVGRAALGGALFGVMGVIVGGMAQKKTVSRTKTDYLFVTYTGDSGLVCVGFEEDGSAKGGGRQDFGKLVWEFGRGDGFAPPQVQEL